MPPDPDYIAVLEQKAARLERAVAELSLVNELALAISSARDVAAMTEVIVHRSLQAVDAEQGVLTLISDEGTDPTQTLVRSMRSDTDRDPLRPDQSLVGWMHLHLEPLTLNDPWHDERFLGTPWHRTVRSVLCVPLIVQQRLIGLLTVYNKKHANGFTPGDQRLLAILAAQSAQFVENARLSEREQQLRHMQEELETAREIQTNLLPKAAPTIAGYDIAGTSLPAQTVGGDALDFIPAGAHRLALYVADVSGKGLPAALLMANVQATLRSQTLSSPTPEACVNRSNYLLCENIQRGKFVTLFYGILDTRAHTLTYVNAGHNRPFLMRHGEAAHELAGGGLVLGALPNFTYTASSTTLAPGDTLVIYSDGITEAMNFFRQTFDEHRLAEVLQTHHQASATDLLHHIIDAVQQYAGNVPQSDDMTLLVVKRA